MMNDRILYELLYQFIVDYFKENNDLEFIKSSPEDIWECFWVESSGLDKRYTEIRHLITSIAKEIERKDKLKCQYCRIDEGFLVEPPIEAHNLCKRHLQEFEEKYEDRTLKQNHPGFTPIMGTEGLSCGPPTRYKYV